jgi:hypothetical protein
VARGGVYGEGQMQQFNFQDTYLRTVLAFIGLNDVEPITVEVSASDRKLLTAQWATRWPRCPPSPLDLFEVDLSNHERANPMSRIPTHAVEDAPEASRPLLQKIAQSFPTGRPLNAHAQMAHSPAVLAAYTSLHTKIGALTSVVRKRLSIRETSPMPRGRPVNEAAGAMPS